MMNRDEALKHVAKRNWWPELGRDPVWGAPEEWSWFYGDAGMALTHSIHDPITRADWQDARSGGSAPTPTAEPDMVNHPPHYQSDNGIECIDAIRAALGRERHQVPVARQGGQRGRPQQSDLVHQPGER